MPAKVFAEEGILADEVEKFPIGFKIQDHVVDLSLTILFDVGFLAIANQAYYVGVFCNGVQCIDLRRHHPKRSLGRV